MGGPQAQADPITVSLNVRITNRTINTVGPVESFIASFPLQFTYDPSSLILPYGQPTISPDILSIPLDFPAPPEGLALNAFGGTIHSRVGSTDSPVIQAGLSTGIGNLNATQFYAASLQISTFGIRTANIVSAETYPLHLTEPVGGGPNFFFNVCAANGIPIGEGFSCLGQPGSFGVAYRGFAILADESPNPVPEPATMLLVGGGLALVGRYRMRRTRAA